MKQSDNTLPIRSDEATLCILVESSFTFNVPIYQRLFVWGTDQISTLLDDLVNAYSKKEEKYYLGGIMITRNKSDSSQYSSRYDLIDGQQRFTTLWLVSKFLGHELSKFAFPDPEDKTALRISFSVRDFANHYFAHSDNARKYDLQEERELKPLRTAVAMIERYFTDERCLVKKEDQASFASYLYDQVSFVVTEMPPNTDENKVFEAMNNRGIQLQQHEILKSRLLSSISEVSLRNRYAKMWDACSMMDNYLEKNIKDVAGLQWKQLFSDTPDEEKNVDLPGNILAVLQSVHTDKSAFSLSSVLGLELTESEISVLKKGENNEENYESANSRSIISFPMLLLHTLRIYQKRFQNDLSPDESAEVNAKELIDIFKKSGKHLQTSQEVGNFIQLLWEVREKFDRFVIKWVVDDEGDRKTEHHIIQKLYQSKTAFQRTHTKRADGFALLQSMLYHSQQLTTHYWLTPFLNYLLEGYDTIKNLEYLERLDNEMFCNPRRDLRKMSFQMMFIPIEDMKGNAKYIEDELKKPLGVKFSHYLFYKTEYVLWKSRDMLFSHSIDKSKWDNYRMTSKNSVEHVFPQIQKEENKHILFIDPIEEEIFSMDLNMNLNAEIKNRYPFGDDFGNLVLLSPGMNSQYSNKPYPEKRAQFNSKPYVDSLKSDLIFKHEGWTWKKAVAHRNEIIHLFQQSLT